MTILVTGGAGFVGRHVVAQLAGPGEKVVTYDRDYCQPANSAVVAVQGELFDLPALVRTLTGHGVGAVIHTAAMSHPEISVELPVTTFAANVDGTLNLLEAARMAGVRRIVNFSSECAYGDQDESAAVHESACPMPSTPYGVTKVATEHLGRVYNKLYGLDVVSLRLTEVYGPGLKMPEVLKDMVLAALRGEAFTLSHGAGHRFQFIHVEDAARSAILAVRASTPRQGIYNISGGSQVTLGELADLIRVRLPAARIDLGPGHLPGWDRQGPFDISAAARELGYSPEWPLERGLDSYIAWLREQPL
jgi:UDP-glucose 4-epimerase